MEACIANPAASIDLHEVLYGVVTPAGQWWGQTALKRLVSPISSIAGYSMQAFRNQQPREIKQPVSHAIELEQSDSDDFQIGTAHTDSTEMQAPTDSPAASVAKTRLPPSLGSTGKRPIKPVVAEQTENQLQASTSALAQPGKGAISSSLSVDPREVSPSSSSSHDGGKVAKTLMPPVLPRQRKALKPRSPGVATQAAATGPPIPKQQPQNVAPNPEVQSDPANAAGKQQPVLPGLASQQAEAAKAPEAKAKLSSALASEQNPVEIRASDSQSSIPGASDARPSQVTFILHPIQCTCAPEDICLMS